MIGAVRLLTRRDISRHFGRFLLQVLSLFTLTASCLSLAARVNAGIQDDRARRAVYGDAWVIGNLITQESSKLSPIGQIPSERVERMLSLSGVDRQRSFRVLSLTLSNPGDLEPLVFAADPSGLTQMMGIPEPEIRAAEPDRLWLGHDLATYFAVHTGERVSLGQHTWKVAVLPERDPTTNTTAAMTLEAAQRLLRTGPVVSYAVLYGTFDLLALQKAAGSYKIFAPGTALPDPLGSFQVRNPAILWNFTGAVLLLFCITWMFGAIYTTEQRPRAGTLRAIGGAFYTRAGPLVLTVAMVVLLAVACGTTVMVLASSSTVSTWQGLWVLALHFVAPVALPLVGATLLTLLPHVITLLREPCVPRQASPKYLVLPALLLLAWMTQVLNIEELSDVTARRFTLALGDAARQSVRVSDVSGDGSGALPEEIVHAWLSLSSVDPTKSYAELSSSESPSPFTMIHTRGLAPEDLPKVLGGTESMGGNQPWLVHPDSVIVGHRVARDMKLEAGSTVQLYGQTWEVNSVLEPSPILDYSVIFPIGALSQAIGRLHGPNAITLYPTPGADIDAVQRDVATMAGDISLTLVLTPETWSQYENNVAISPLYHLVIGAAFCVAVSSAMWTISNLQAHRHLRELAVLRALGATKWRAARGVLKEGMKLAVTSTVVGVLLSYLFNLVFNWPLYYGWEFASYGATSALIVLSAMLGTIPPALSLLRKPPAAALRTE